MTRLVWDEVGKRTYEVGLDHGVLYVNDTAVVWNGLISIEDSGDGEENVPVYIDGLKIRDIPSIGDYSADLSAYTYPDEFLECEGVEFVNGTYLDGQNPKRFSLSFRTLVANDIEGVDHGYRLHIAYDLTAIPDTKTYQTMSLSPSPMEFMWTIYGVPQKASGFRPTAHIIFDSRFIASDIMRDIESIIYGDDNSDPFLPPIEFFIQFAYNHGLLTIIDHGNGIWTAQDSGQYISTIDSTTFQIDAPSVVILDSVTYKVSTIPS